MKAIKKELSLIRKYEKIVKIKYLDWDDQTYNNYENWKEKEEKIKGER